MDSFACRQNRKNGNDNRPETGPDDNYQSNN